MSFGFSASDIILLGQLAYRLCNALKGDNRPACQELSSALFGLRCALDHLSRQAKQNPTISNRETDGVERMHGDLDTLISSCADTLLQLECMFAKYSDELKSDDTNSGINMTTESSTKRGGMLLRTRAKVKANWMKIRWSTESQSLLDFRVKLQTHTDSINIVLNAFIWSASQRIETRGEESARQLSKIEEQAVKSNEALLKAVREIREFASEPPQQSLPQISYPFRHNGNLQIVSAEEQQPASCIQPSELPGAQSDSSHEQPAELRWLNQGRFILGNREFQHFGETRLISSIASKPRAARRSTAEKQLTIAGLMKEIDSIASGQYNASHVESRNEVDAISAWTKRFEELVDRWRANPTKRELEKQTRLERMQTLLLSLNRVMATREDITRRVWYRVMVEHGIERIFDKLRALLRSVTIEKEIQAFDEDLEELCLI